MQVLKLVGGIALAGAIAFAAPADAKKGATASKSNKVDVCHLDEETGERFPISISVNAFDSHAANHGDWAVASEEVCDDGIDNNCDGEVDEGCAPPPPADPCPVFTGTQCYWMGFNGTAGAWCWEPATWAGGSQSTCQYLDSCSAAGGGGSGGGCYKWSDGSNGAGSW